MSTQQGSNRPEGEKPSEGLSKYIKRMRTVLRRSSTAKTSSVSSMQEVTGGESSRDNEYVLFDLCSLCLVIDD